MHTFGLLAAVGAMISWAIGDYSIEQTTRKVGDWKTIFYIGLGGFIGITPFVYKEIPAFLSNSSNIRLIVLLTGFSLLSALLLFEALKEGKLSIVEPVFGLELPSVIILSIAIGGEKLNPVFYILSAVVFAGLILAVTKWEHLRIRKHWLEKGVILAMIGAIVMGVTDFITGYSSRVISPLLTIWCLHSLIGVIAFLYLIFRKQTKNLFKDILIYPKSILSLMFFDNFAWVAYAYSMVYLPISVATTITETFIALSVLLGVFINKEKIQRHQVFGIILVVAAVLLLSYLVGY